MTSESERIPQPPNPGYAAFAALIGEFDGRPRICLLSMSRDPAAIYWVDPEYARQLAKLLNQLADQLDPPKKEWRAIDAGDGKLHAAFEDHAGHAETAARILRDIAKRKRTVVRKAKKAK